MPIEKGVVPKELMTDDMKKWMAKYRSGLRTFKMLQGQAVKELSKVNQTRSIMGNVTEDLDFLISNFPEQPTKEIPGQG